MENYIDHYKLDRVQALTLLKELQPKPLDMLYVAAFKVVENDEPEDDDDQDNWIEWRCVDDAKECLTQERGPEKLLHELLHDIAPDERVVIEILYRLNA